MTWKIRSNYASPAVLLLHGDGTQNSTDIIDSSTPPKTVSVNGPGVYISEFNSVFGGSSIGYVGPGDYLSIADDDDWDIEGDYTIEFWAYHGNSGINYTKGYLGTETVFGTSGFAIGHYLDDLVIATPSGTMLSTSQPVTPNTWNHIAVVWSSTTVKGYVNGVEALSGATFTTSTSVPLIIGNYANLDVNRWYTGYIDELRITKGIARYTTNFTPPTAAFLDSD
jgi:hypothetical protein